MKHVITSLLAIAIFASCGKTDQKSDSSSTPDNADKKISEYDPGRGEGKFENLEISDKLDVTMATTGKAVFDLKCSSCHKLTDEKLVGPGWKGVSTRHKPEWIMNFITSPDGMIDKDPKLQAQLELCLVRMPNQNLSDEDARHILEFMRQNDGIN